MIDSCKQALKDIYISQPFIFYTSEHTHKNEIPEDTYASVMHMHNKVFPSVHTIDRLVIAVTSVEGWD